MFRWMSVAALLAFLGAGLTLSACESTQDSGTTAQSQSQFEHPFDGSLFKGRRD
jgi:hypothetical protein